MDGLLNILKPSGMTSSDVVVSVRKILQTKKVGHCGTLDPLAVGVLPIAVGKGTKLFNFLLHKQKTYRAFFTFGKETDTLDSQGQVTRISEVIPSRQDVLNCMASCVGNFDQIPPLYSAKSVDGRRAYEIARSGQHVSLAAKNVTIFQFDLVRQVSEDTYCFDITTSSGTYIRSIVRDMAEQLGTVGYMSGLIRTKSGMFDIENGVTLDELQHKGASAIVGLQEVLAEVEQYDFDKKHQKDLNNGVKVKFLPKEDKLYRIFCQGEFFGLGKSKEGKLDLEYYLR